MDRFSEYRIMWVLVFFDLPTESKRERKLYADFRKETVARWIYYVSFSIYVRHCLVGRMPDRPYPPGEAFYRRLEK